MPQILKGDTFANSQQLTAARLNQLVDSAQILVGAITEQPLITPSTLVSTDTTIVNDGGVLKQTSVSDILNSGIPVTTPSITSTANNDVIVTPLDGVSVAGSNYTSIDGLTVVVTTLSPHGLSVNNVVLISGAGVGYNGTFFLTNVTSTTFTYVMLNAATPTASPTACTYVRKASQIVNGNIVSSGYIFAKEEVDTLRLQVDGQANINNSTTKTANITTALQFSGVPVFGLVSIEDTNVPFTQCDATTEAQRVATCNQWRVITSLNSQTKTDKEIWVIEADFPLVYYPFAGAVKFSIHRLSTATNIAMQFDFMQNNGAAYISYDQKQVKMKCVIPAGVTFTGETIQLRFRYNAQFATGAAIANVGFGGSITDTDITRVLRVTKYAKP